MNLRPGKSWRSPGNLFLIKDASPDISVKYIYVICRLGDPYGEKL